MGSCTEFFRACVSCLPAVCAQTVCFDCHLYLLSAFSSLFLVLFPYLWNTCSKWQVVKPIPVWRPLSSQLRFLICYQLLFRLYLHWLRTTLSQLPLQSSFRQHGDVANQLWPVASILQRLWCSWPNLHVCRSQFKPMFCRQLGLLCHQYYPFVKCSGQCWFLILSFQLWVSVQPS